MLNQDGPSQFVTGEGILIGQFQPQIKSIFQELEPSQIRFALNRNRIGH
jgi:hypothetical protein